MRLFRWLSGQDIPPEHDLRKLGWTMISGGRDQETPGQTVPLLVDAPRIGGTHCGGRLKSCGRDARRRMLLLGVDAGDERARLLGLGFGEVVGCGVGLAELAARMQRIAHMADLLPRFREHGALRLDLAARDGFVEGRPVGLHPREFALIWRLADAPGVPASKASLIADVWRSAFVPETNSLAVHIARLRRKLAVAGLDGLVQTTREGAYWLVPVGCEPARAIPLAAGQNPLDAHVLAGEGAQQEEASG